MQWLGLRRPFQAQPSYIAARFRQHHIGNRDGLIPTTPIVAKGQMMGAREVPAKAMRRCHCNPRLYQPCRTVLLGTVTALVEPSDRWVGLRRRVFRRWNQIRHIGAWPALGIAGGDEAEREQQADKERAKNGHLGWKDRAGYRHRQ